MTPIPTLWSLQAQAATREVRRRAPRHAADATDAYSSDDEAEQGPVAGDEAAWPPGTSHRPGALPSDVSALAEQAEDRRWLPSTNVVARAGSTQHTAEVAARQRIEQEARRSARAEHLPWRGQAAEDARLLRVLKGLPPLGSTADADQLSDWEDTLENAKLEHVRFGERDIVQIGRRRTLAEEELSHMDDDVPPALDLLGTDAPALLAPVAWDGSTSAELDADITPGSLASLSHTSLPVRVRARPHLMGPPDSLSASPAGPRAPALWAAEGRAESMYMDGDLDGDLDDMDTSRSSYIPF
ncbi:unnamed protein product [Malassezia sympodialis ATCC 42132]|uniref:Uncharacterized protein n=1 Tax=Malassezia sympodialis (strain ATCC 42132) TaxID=1230383 RepID=M5E810_MALS4|nr:uncharacterized protein MSY001_1540 [Malassezia sympodialis ATCC 42132]CCU98834.1 unnamed protein product [Malassezia sympodialis ATCC 42132]SHO79083.1 Hypothetical protein MSYG_3432 [Malassezia sympodialis ATCC 42132]|eukprot:XP_018740115.1 uncharacterized protein MSY001_1540 [Malassezia sympodialis ATCC 42132]